MKTVYEHRREETNIKRSVAVSATHSEVYRASNKAKHDIHFIYIHRRTGVEADVHMEDLHCSYR